MRVVKLRTRYDLRQITLDLSIKDCKLIILVYITLDLIQCVFRNHDVNTIRFHIQSNLASNRCGLCRLDHDLILAGFHCDLIVDTLEYN